MYKTNDKLIIVANEELGHRYELGSEVEVEHYDSPSNSYLVTQVLEGGTTITNFVGANDVKLKEDE